MQSYVQSMYMITMVTNKRKKTKRTIANDAGNN